MLFLSTPQRVYYCVKILFDQGTPVPLRNFLEGNGVSTAYELGLSHLSNGDLINAAEQGGFEILITTDRNLRYQQNLSKRRISIFVLPTTSWPKLRLIAPDISKAILRTGSGVYVEYPGDMV